MQDPNADTQWNDALRHHGILPAKQQTEQEITEADVVTMVEQTIQEKSQGKSFDKMGLDELDDIEDEIDEEEERLFEEYRKQRMSEMKAAQLKARFGDVGEISREDYKRQVNQAGDGIWVILHVYKQGIPLCSLLNQHLAELARKFPDVKFLKSISSVCIPNYPDKNLPTIFVYFEGDLKKQFIGPHEFGGMNLKQDELEWILAKAGALKTQLEENPKKAINDVMESSIRSSNINDDSDSD